MVNCCEAVSSTIRKQAQECVDRILKETTHMTALITDILDDLPAGRQ